MADFATQYLAGLQMGRQRRLQDQALEQRNQLGRLVGESLTAPVTARDSYLGQIAGLDPDAALTLSTRFQSEAKAAQEAEQARVQNMARLFTAAPAQSRATMWGQIRPALQGMGFDAPEQWDAGSLMPVVQQLGGAGQEGPQSAQRAYVEWLAAQVPEEERGEFYRVQAGLAPRQQNQRYSVQATELADGGVRYDRIPTISGNVAGSAPAMGGMPPAAPMGSTPAPQPTATPNMDAVLAQANEMARRGVPDADIERYIASAAQQAGVAVTPAGQPTMPSPAPPQSQLDANAQRTIQSQTFGAPAPVAPAMGGGVTSTGQATNETRAAAAAAERAAIVRAEEEAKREVSRPGLRRIADRGINDGVRKVGMINTIIAQEIRPNIDGWTTGTFSNFLGGIGGTRAADLSASLDALKAYGAFSELASMRAASPTGSALGSVTENELKLLEASFGDITQSRSPAAFERAVQRYQEQVQMSWQNVLDAYEDEFGERPNAPETPMQSWGGAAAPTPDLESRIDQYLRGN